MRASTERKLKGRRRDKLYELVRLSKMLRVPPWGGPNGVKPLHWDEWRDSVASVILVGHRTRSASTVGDSKDLRLEKAIKKSRRIVRNKVRDRLLLWERFLSLLAELREGEFVSCYCRGNFETVCLTILDFPSIFIATRTLEKVARRLLPIGNDSVVVRTKFSTDETCPNCGTQNPRNYKFCNGCGAKRIVIPRRMGERWKNPPRFKRWVQDLPKYLEELSWDVVAKPTRPTARQQPGGNGSGKDTKILAKGLEAKKKKTAQKKAPRRASSNAKKSVAKKVVRAKSTRPTRRKQTA